MPVDVNVTLPNRRAATCEAALMEPHLRADQLGVRSECRALQGDRDPDPPAGRHVSPNDAQVWRVRQSQTTRACCCRRARERDCTNQSDVGTARHHPEVTSARPRKVVRSGDIYERSRRQGDLVPDRLGSLRRSSRSHVGAGGIRSGSQPKERLRMAVGIRIKLAGITQEQFDKAHDHINPDRSPLKGLLFHASGLIDGELGDHRLLGIARGVRCLRGADR